jgi:hypothetical protein
MSAARRRVEQGAPWELVEGMFQRLLQWRRECGQALVLLVLL